MRTSLLIIFLFFSQVSFSQWNPDAGIVQPVSANAIIEVSSGTSIDAIIDGNLQTYWESTNPLPSNYITRKDLNIFLNNDKFSIIRSANNSGNAFDGIISSKSIIESGNIEIKFEEPEKIILLSIKLNTSDTVWITINQEKPTNYLPSENYSLKEIKLLNVETITSIKLECNKTFEIFEIAGLYSLPTEEIVFDLGSTQDIGWISSRHYNGEGVVSISMYVSDNSTNWKQITTLNQLATAFIPQLISPVVEARYIKLQYVLKPDSYQKAKLQEFELYDRYGPFGKPKPAKFAKKTYSQSFGVNTVWGWGYYVYSDLLTNENGPTLFNKVAKLARNYHSINWDIKKPTDNPDYANMKLGNGTISKDWLNWDREYSTWKTAGFDIDACIMFNNEIFSDSLWSDTENEALNFGAYFADHFSNNTSLFSVVEVGNEPWEYSKPVYRNILAGMSKGLKLNSKKLTVLPCAIQAYSVSLEYDNYISKFVDTRNSKHIDGLNTHLYSYTFNYNGDRIAVNPEDPRSEVWSVSNLQTFSNINLNSLPVYVTEFGYDSEGGGDDCIHDVCINEFEQAIYGTRMALILYRLGTEQFYWYYFANVDYISMLHNRSGLTSSYSKGFTKKQSFKSFELLQKLLGDYYFHHIIMETNDVYAYAFSDASGQIKRLIAWRPTSEDHNKHLWMTLPFSEVIDEVIPLVSGDGYEENISYVRGVNELKISLSGVPVVIKIKD
jgi:hypothetical protein